MAPSTLLQSRINAFEALGRSPSVSPRNNGPSVSPNILEEPISSEADSFSPIVPFIPAHSISRSPSPSPPNLGRKSSLIDLRDWIVDDGPSPPRQNDTRTETKDTNGKTAMSNGDVRTPTQRAWNVRANGGGSSAPLINLESPPKVIKPAKVPPLPPRKPSDSSLKAAMPSHNNGLRPPVRSDSLTVEQHSYPPLSKPRISDASPGHGPASSISSFHSVSLSSDGGTIDGESPYDQLHIATFPMDRHSSEGDADTNSLDESFENVSSLCVVSPTTAATLAFDWDKAMGKAKQLGPPKLPQRPSSKSPSSVPPIPLPSTRTPPPPPPPRSVPASPKLSTRSISSSSITTTNRRVPPPPPPHTLPPSRFTSRSSRASLASTSASDRSSILSTVTTTSRTSISTRASTQMTSKLSRPTPVPAAAKKRYEAVFIANVVQRRKAEKSAAMKKAAMLAPPGTRKSRQAAGWRGLSVDLITNPPVLSGKEKDEEDEEDIDGDVDIEDRLDGSSVKIIWGASKLERGKLKAIWNECDPGRHGSLDRDAFVKGMWRIDEELRRTQFTRHKGRIRAPPQIKYANPRPILR